MLQDGIEATHEVVQNWFEHGVTEEEVQAAIETLTGSYIVGLSTTGSVAGQVHSFMQRGFAPEYIDEYPLRVRTLTAADVNRAIQKYFDPAKLIEVAAGSLAKAPAAKENESTQIPVTVRLDTPDAAWQVQIVKIYRTQESIVAISQLKREADVMGAQVISTVADTVEIDSQWADLPVRHYILGKTWEWGDTGEYSFIESSEAFGQALDQAELLFSREK